MTPEDGLLIEDLEKDPEFSKIDIQKELSHYREVVGYMGANAPIGVLCLPRVIENILAKNDIVRVYDLINYKLDGIKGLGVERIDLIRARCDEFFSMPI
jgi:hypothetical protein